MTWGCVMSRLEEEKHIPAALAALAEYGCVFFAHGDNDQVPARFVVVKALENFDDPVAHFFVLDP